MGGHGGLNILPQKSWHVYRKDNVSKVERDEAKAREQEQEAKEKSENAEREFRRNLLLQRISGEAAGPSGRGGSGSSEVVVAAPQQPRGQHINFWSEDELQLRAQHPEAVASRAEKRDEVRRRGKEDFYTTDAKFDERFKLGYGLVGDQPWYAQKPAAPKAAGPAGLPRTAAAKNDRAIVSDLASPALPAAPEGRPSRSAAGAVTLAAAAGQPSHSSHSLSSSSSDSSSDSSSSSDSDDSSDDRSRKKRRKGSHRGAGKRARGGGKRGRSSDSSGSDNSSRGRQKRKRKGSRGSRRSSRSGDRRGKKEAKAKRRTEAAARRGGGGLKSVAELRAERLKREEGERLRERQLLMGMQPAVEPKEYNSAFGYGAALRNSKRARLDAR